jgi:hypothetical protein
MFEEAFSGDDDEVIADVVSVWIVSGYRTPSGGCARYFAKRVENGSPFSPRLRRVAIRVICGTWRHGVEVSTLETVRLLNCLNVDVDDMGKHRNGESCW